MRPHLRMHLPPAPQCRSTAQPHSLYGQTVKTLPETALKEVGMYHMMKESAVEKAKNRAVEKLREILSWQRAPVWRIVHHMMQRPIPLLENNVGLWAEVK